jgi:uncharacterized protein (DUF885 family)
VYTYDAFAADLHDRLTQNPNDCVHLGVMRRLDELPDPSRDYIAADVEATRALLARLKDVERRGLTPGQALDLDLAGLMLSARLNNATYTFNGRTMKQQMPTAGDDISNGIFMMFVNDPRPAGERLSDITARVEKVPAYLEALLDRLAVPVARWVAMDLDKAGGLPELFASVVGWADEVGFPDAARLRSAVSRAEEALRSYLERLRALPTTTQLHAGDEIARRIVALRGIELSLEEIHAVAKNFLADTRQILGELRVKLAAKYGLDKDATGEEVLKPLKRRYRLKVEGGRLEGILEYYQRERERILAFIRERDLFPLPEAQDMKIMRTPGFLAPSIPAGAMQPPPPFREGVRTSVVYLTLSEGLFDEHTALDIAGMMVHEGIPGHHLQLSMASLNPSLIRRHADALDQAEGWTTMLEDYMLDQGYMGELTDEARYCGKYGLSRIGARVAIDLFFMTGERGFLDVGVPCDISPADPFQAAGNLLAAITGFVPERVEGELNWYSQERGYPLSYLTGNHLVWGLKRDMAAHQAGKLSGLELDREFHKTFLDAGSMPLSFLRREFKNRGLLA